MSDDHASAAKAPADSAKKQAKRPVDAVFFAEITSGMSRLLTKLSDFEPFHEAKIGIAEWSLMNALARGEGANRELSRDLGITKQRINQICETLKKSGYVSTSTDAADSRRHTIKLTATGAEQLQKLNASITPILIEGLKGRERMMDLASKSVKALARVVSEKKSPGAKEERLARRAADKADKVAQKKARPGKKEKGAKKAD